MNSNSISLTYLDKVYGLNFTQNFQELKKLLAKCLNLTFEELDGYVIKYLDDEDDYIIISNQSDYDQAFLLMQKINQNCLQICMNKKNEISSRFTSSFFPSKTNICLDNSEEIKKSIITPIKDVPFEKKDDNKDINSAIIENVWSKEDTKANKEALIMISDEGENKKLDEKLVNQELRQKIINETINLDSSIGNLIEDSPKIHDYTGDPAFMDMKQNIVKFLQDFINQEFNSLQERVLTQSIQKSEEEIKKFLQYRADKEKEKIEQIKKEEESNLNKHRKLSQDKLKKEEEPNNIRKSSVHTINAVHSGVKCSNCNQIPIVGVRYKCYTCSNYNLCEKCEDEISEEHNHPFLKIRTSEVEIEKTSDKVIRQSESISFSLNKNLENIPLSRESVQSIFISSAQEANNVEKLQSECITDNLFFLAKTDLELRVNLKIRNSGGIAWPKNCYLVCIEDKSDIKGKSIPLNLKVDPMKECTIELKVYTGKKEGLMKSTWRLNCEKTYFGKEIILLVNVKNDSSVIIDPSKNVNVFIKNNSKSNDYSDINNISAYIDNNSSKGNYYFKILLR